MYISFPLWVCVFLEISSLDYLSHLKDFKSTTKSEPYMLHKDWYNLFLHNEDDTTHLETDDLKWPKNHDLLKLTVLNVRISFLSGTHNYILKNAELSLKTMIYFLKQFMFRGRKRFRTTWGWINDMIFILGWNIPFMCALQALQLCNSLRSFLFQE